MKAISLFLFLLASCSSHEDHLSKESRLNRMLKQCYEESDSMIQNPPVQGKIKFRIMVNGDGTVQSVEIIESDFKKDANLEVCTKGILKKSKVEPPVKDTAFELIQPVNFVPVMK